MTIFTLLLYFILLYYIFKYGILFYYIIVQSSIRILFLKIPTKVIFWNKRIISCHSCQQKFRAGSTLPVLNFCCFVNRKILDAGIVFCTVRSGKPHNARIELQHHPFPCGCMGVYGFPISGGNWVVG